MATRKGFSWLALIAVAAFVVACGGTNDARSPTIAGGHGGGIATGTQPCGGNEPAAPVRLAIAQAPGAIDAANVYWTTMADGTGQGAVMRIAK